MAVGFQSPGDATNAYFLAFVTSGAAGLGAWVPFQFFATGQANACGVTGLNQSPILPKIQFGVGNNLYYFTNPGQDPFLASNYATIPQTVYLSADAGIIEDEDKVFEYLDIISDNASLGTIKVAYATYNYILNLNYTDLGIPIGFQTVSQKFNTPNTLLKYKKINFRVTIVPGSAGGSPILRDIVLHYKQRGPQRRFWDLKIQVEANLVGPTATLDVRGTKQIVQDLNAARISRVPVPFVDILGQTTNVYVEEVDELLEIYKNAPNPSYMVSVKIVESVTS
jgi:hypothetical protein